MQNHQKLLQFPKENVFLLILVVLIFSGCNEFYKTEQIKVKIVDIVPPKYFKIIVKDSETNEKPNEEICRNASGVPGHPGPGRLLFSEEAIQSSRPFGRYSPSPSCPL